jgi:hypothetical protein
MVKKNFFRMLFVTAALIVGSCASNGDIDDLKDQLGELENQVGDLEGDLSRLELEQQAELSAEIAALQAEIAALQGQAGGLTSDYDALLESYDALLTDLTDLDEEVASAAKVHYGSILTAEDLASFVTSEATIVTGDVVISSQDNVASLAKLELVGGNVTIKGGTAIDLPMLESVSGFVTIEGVNDEATVSLPVLAAIGKSVVIANNAGLTSVDMPELLLVNGSLRTMANSALTTLTMAKLDMVAGDLEVNEFWAEDPDYLNYGKLAALDLSSADVMGSASIEYILGAEIMLGNVANELFVSNTQISKLEMTGSEIDGTVTIEKNGELAEILFPNLITVNGNVIVYSNASGGGWIGVASGKLKDLSCFDMLQYIGGDVHVTANDFSSLDAFNNVTTVYGRITSDDRTNAIIEFNQNGQEKTLVNIFNALEGSGTGINSYGYPNNHKVDISISEKTDWFNGFEMLEKAGLLDILIQVTQDPDYNQGTAAIFDGFDALVEFTGAVHDWGTNSTTGTKLILQEVTEFNAFPVLENIYGTYNARTAPYLTLNVPNNATVSLCTLSALLVKIQNGDFSATVPALFKDGNLPWPGETTVDAVIATYATGCTI